MNDKMKPEVKAKWVTALRSKEYTQGQKVLHNVDEGTYCCLGVLCELAVKDGLDVTVNDSLAEDYDNIDTVVTYYDESNVVLPLSVLEWAGMKSDVGVFTDKGGTHMLTALNDDGKDFDYIANVIEEYF